MSSRLALALSASALVVALLGSTPIGHAIASQVPRNSVGSQQLKRNAVGPQKLAPNAVRTGHVLNGSLLAADFKAGQLPAGRQGPAGPSGPAGAAGPAGPAGVTERQVVTVQSALDSSSPKSVTASCPMNKVPLGGGAEIFGFISPVALDATRPSVGSSWFARAHEVNPTEGIWRLTTYVVCARVG